MQFAKPLEYKTLAVNHRGIIPSMQKTNRVVKIRLTHPDNRQTNARMEAARCWNDMVKLHRYIRQRRWKWPSESQLKKHIKGRYNLHSQTIQALAEKLIANIETTQTNRKKWR